MSKSTTSNRLPAIALWVVGTSAILFALLGIATLFHEQAEMERTAERAGIGDIPGVTPLDALPFFLIIGGFGGVLIAVGIFFWLIAGKTVKV